MKERPLIEEDWAEPVRAAMRAAPDPERARKLAEKVLAAVPRERLDAAAIDQLLAEPRDVGEREREAADGRDTEEQHRLAYGRDPALQTELR